LIDFCEGSERSQMVQASETERRVAVTVGYLPIWVAHPRHRGPAPQPASATERWSIDFVHDALANGRPFRVLTVVDQWSRQSPILEVGPQHVRREPSATPWIGCCRPRRRCGRSLSMTTPSSRHARSKIGPWRRGVQLDFTRPGKPVENAFIESFQRPAG
jgi:putative transposase